MPFICIAIIVAVFVLDIKVKKYIEETKKLGQEYKHGLIIIRHARNKGAVMSLFEKRSEFVKYASLLLTFIMALFLLFTLPRKGLRLFKLGLALMVGGSAGNVYDRMKRGYVVDYFSFSFFKRIIFNISDMCIIVGAMLTAAGAPVE